MTDELEDLRRLDLPFDVDKVDSQCHRCVRDQLKKYEKHTTKEGLAAKGKFTVPCTGIPLLKIDPLLRSSLTDEQVEQVEAINDPVLFAKKYIKNNDNEPWIAREHQAHVLRCTSKRKCLRISRRSGKTDLVVIEIIYSAFTKPNQRILVIGPQKKHASEIFGRIKEKIYANSFLATAIVRDVASPHSVLALKNGSEIRGFAGGTKGKGDSVAVRGEDASKIFLEECLPVGSLVNTSEFAIRPIESLLIKGPVFGGDHNGILNGEITALGTRKSNTITLSTGLGKITCTPNHPIFDGRIDVPAKDADEVIMSLYHRNLTFDQTVITARLLGFIYGDGWLSGNTVGFSGQEIDLQQVVEDCVLLGDSRHKISTRECENKERGIKGIGSCFVSTYLYPIFKDLAPQGKKVYQPLRVPSLIKNGRPYIKTAFLSGLFSAEATGIRYQKNEITPTSIRLKMLSTKEEWIKDWIGDISDLLKDIGISHSSKFKTFVDPFINEERVSGEITVFGSHDNLVNFINKIGYCYNASKTVSSNKFLLFNHYKMMWKQEWWCKNRAVRKYIGKFTTKEIAGIIRLKFDTVKYHKNYYHPLYSEDLLAPEEYIKTITWVENYVKLPINKAATKRSEELVDVYNLTSTAANRFFAEGILTHNCAYIDEKAIQGAILPILQTKEDVTICAFSTPSAFKTTTFYKFCKESPNYKEFHYDYKVLPWWKQIEEDSSMLTEEEFETEYLAIFPDSGGGVYKPSYVERALSDYKYEDMRRNPIWKYTMGVDWNEKHGAEIVVLGYDPMNRRHQVVEAVNVEGAEFTQLNSVNKVIEMNKKWKPLFVYVDSGNGSTNIELMTKMAYDAIGNASEIDTARLKETLRKYDSGAAIEITDAITHQKEKKPAKSFMVNCSVRFFEQNKIKLSSYDNILKAQLDNYIIERISPSGNPVYGLEKESVLDHRLDAFNLSIVAFQLNFDELHKQNISYDVAAALDPRTMRIADNGDISVLVSRPETRDFGSDFMSIEDKLVANAMPGRIDLKKIKSTRPGWDTDQEQERYLENLQRKQAKNKRNLRSTYSKPSRQNF